MTIPRLVYRIYLHSDSEKNTEYGYVDAHTGKTVFTSPISTDLTNDGIFETRYNGIQHGITQETPKGYRLADTTRGSGIEVRNLEGRNIYEHYVEVIDNDNNWTRQEHGTNNNDMALDVYWTLQQIYDRLKIIHGINSYDDKGFPIIAYIRHGTDGSADNASWTMDRYLAFGAGKSVFYPLASADVIGHEFGHGITHFNIGWKDEGIIFNEGLSDIWGAIFKHAINPNSQYWKSGDQIARFHSCLRNMQYPTDSKAKTQIADTYGSELYWKTNNFYVRSGVFSHWFYLLVNGKTGTNSIGNQYLVKGIGMEKAEKLIVNTVYSGYLRGTYSYTDIRNAFIHAAIEELNDASIAQQISNAWYAVGVGTQVGKPTIIGKTLVCDEETYTISDELPANAAIFWSPSNTNLQLVSGQKTRQAVFKRNGNGACEVAVNISINSVNVSNALKVWVGLPATPTLLGTDEKGLYRRGWDYRLAASNTPEEGVVEYEWTAHRATIKPYSDGSWAIFTPDRQPEPVSVDVRARNACGWGQEASVWGLIDDGYAAEYAKPTGINDNPQTDGGMYKIEIWNSMRLLEAKPAQEPKYDQYLERLPQGIYFVRIIRDGRIVDTKKVLKP